MAISVLLIGHCEVDRMGVAELFVGTEAVLAGHAWNASSALAKLRERDFDIVIADAQLPNCDPMQLLADIRSISPNQPFIMMSRYDNPAAVIHSSSLGANGQILKTDSREQVLTVIRNAVNGVPGWTRDDLRRVTSSASAIPTSRENEVPLTLREGEVLERLSHGRTNKEIAQELGISYETVKEHVQHILRKVGVSDRTQAAVWAVRRQLI